MVVSTIIPVFGTVIIWAPAAVYSKLKFSEIRKRRLRNEQPLFYCQMLNFPLTKQSKGYIFYTLQHRRAFADLLTDGLLVHGNGKS